MDNKIKLLNFELTTSCPLNCPQCYCTLNTGKDMEKDTAFYWIDESARNGVEVLNFSGGELMCYPYLYEVIHYAHSKGLNVNVALSGFNFDLNSYRKFIELNVNGFFVSLNGSTEEINSRSRNGYKFAISALEILKAEKNPNTTINWVMQNSNADDFENIINLAEAYRVKRLIVISLKPNSSNELSNVPTKQQIHKVATFIRNYNGPVHICVETCFSPMLAVIGDSFFGNTNTGHDKGCMAGRMFASINVDGLLSPCRHLYYFEKWDTLKEYWEHSEILKKIRNVENDIHEPCKSCRYASYCRHCLAINACINHDIYLGNTYCPLYL